MMGRTLRGLVFVLAASLLVVAVGRFRILEILGWAAFFGGLYWSSIEDGRNRCRL